MGKELRFDGKVVVVTGAGNGLGRSHALAFASRGAKVVVNDLGGGHTGEGKGSGAADKVVDEIKAAGGEAVANYDSVEDGEAVIKTAMDAFGRIDVLVNNAGILRDVSFAKMTDADWDLVYRVHVRGAYKTTQAAWPIMREQKFGRIIFTASAAGIYGNFGQANYAMAKLGLVGFGSTLAIEGRKNNVVVNTIAPIAGSRMTETVLPPELLEALKVEYVTELVIKLCHQDNEDTGGLYEVGGGFYSKLRWERTEGKMFRLGRPVTAEDIDANWKSIGDFDKSSHPSSITASLEPIMDNVKAGPSKGGNQYVDVDAALGYEFPEMRSKYDERDLAIYALGIGAAEDPGNEKDLRLVYELHGEGMVGAPSYGVIPAINCVLQLGKEGKSAPGMNYGLDRILHGEQYTELVRPLPLHQKLTHKARIKEIWDKGSPDGKKGGAVIVTAIDTFDEDGNLLVKNETSTFVRGAGGWGGDRGPDEKNLNAPPDRAPDASIEQTIHQNQALLYRLSGDWNPLHADPGFAKAFGFERPILHGLCTFGYATRHVLSSFAKDGDYRFFKSIKVRFADPVLPGETIITEMWLDSPRGSAPNPGSATKILFRVKSKDRDKVVISNAAIELYEQIPMPKGKPKVAAASAGSAVPNSADVFAGIQALVAKAGAEAVGQAKTIFAFKLSNPASIWTLDLKNGSGLCAPGEPVAAECTFELSDADFMDMVSGKADPMKLFTSGKLKIGGNVMASQKLGPILKKVDPNDVMAATQKRTGGAAAAPTASAPLADATPNSADVFSGITAYVSNNADLPGKIKAVYQFKLKGPDAVYTVDLKNGAGSVGAGETTPPDCTLEISDADFMDMVRGKADAMKLFTTGKLKIAGNVMASQKLDFLRKVDPADVMAAAKKRTGGGASAASAPAAAAAPAGATLAPGIVEKIAQRIKDNASLVAEVGAVIELRIKDPDNVYTLDLKNGAGSIQIGKPEKADVRLLVSDADLAALAASDGALQSFYQHGRVRVDGDVSVASKLTFLSELS